MRIIPPQVDLSPEGSRGKPALKRTTGEFQPFCQIIQDDSSTHSIDSILGGGGGGGGSKPKVKPSDQVLRLRPETVKI